MARPSTRSPSQSSSESSRSGTSNVSSQCQSISGLMKHHDTLRNPPQMLNEHNEHLDRLEHSRGRPRRRDGKDSQPNFQRSPNKQGHASVGDRARSTPKGRSRSNSSQPGRNDSASSSVAGQSVTGMRDGVKSIDTEVNLLLSTVALPSVGVLNGPQKSRLIAVKEDLKSAFLGYKLELDYISNELAGNALRFLCEDHIWLDMSVNQALSIYDALKRIVSELDCAQVAGYARFYDTLSRFEKAMTAVVRDYEQMKRKVTT